MYHGEGRVTIGACVVGRFRIDQEDRVIVNFERDAVVLSGSKITIILTDDCDLEEAIRRTSKRGLTVGLNYEPTFDQDDAKFS